METHVANGVMEIDVRNARKKIAKSLQRCTESNGRMLKPCKIVDDETERDNIHSLAGSGESGGTDGIIVIIIAVCFSVRLGV